MPFTLEFVPRWAAVTAVIALALIPVGVLIDLVFRKFGLPIIAGLEVLEYLLLASVVMALPRLSFVGQHITLVWQNHMSSLHTMAIRFVCATTCGVMSVVYLHLALDATTTGAMFRNGLDIPEAPIWMIMGLVFAITGLVELAIFFKRHK